MVKRADHAREARFYNPRTMQSTMLGGLDARSFLRRHWQKHPLLARRALPQYENMMTREDLFALSMRDDMLSRLVVRHGRRWEVAHGPFSRRTLAQLPGRGWTLLVQGVNQVLPRAQALLLEFAFIPYARLDDVMVSYAPPGGGVGPHFDSYDVFLLQIAGARRWRVSRQRDLELVSGAPLKLLRDFRAEHEWTLAAGDMLYLPPHVAHDGIAAGECLTASIGFRAPAAQELAARFLDFLQEKLALHDQYRDPGLRPTVHPAQIGEDMMRQAARMLDGIEWKAQDVVEFLGQYLTEPKAHVIFERPARPLSEPAFARHATRSGVALDLKSQMLFRGRLFFINGERYEAPGAAARLLRKLADHRRLTPPLRLDGGTTRLLYPWYRAGYILLGVKD